MYAKYYRIQKRWRNANGTGTILEPRGLLMAQGQNEEVIIGFSLCEKQDLFTKRTARAIAQRRLKNGYYRASLHNPVALTTLAGKIPQSLQSIYWSVVSRMQDHRNINPIRKPKIQKK